MKRSKRRGECGRRERRTNAAEGDLSVACVSDVSSLWASQWMLKYQYHENLNGNLKTECLMVNYMPKSGYRRMYRYSKEINRVSSETSSGIFSRVLFAF